MALKAHVRQCGACSTTGAVIRSQEVRALLRALLHHLLQDASALATLLPQLVVALFQFRHHPGIELLALHQLRPVLRPTHLDRLFAPSGLASEDASVRGSVFAQSQRNRGSSRKSSCLHKSLDAHCAKADCQFASQSLTNKTFPLLAVYSSAPSSRLASSCSSLVKVDRVQLADLFHRHQYEAIERFFPALPHMNMGLRHPAELLTALGMKVNSSLGTTRTPPKLLLRSTRTAHRTWVSFRSSLVQSNPELP